MVTLYGKLTVTVKFVVAVQRLLLLTVTVYVVLNMGDTLIVAVLLLVFQA